MKKTTQLKNMINSNQLELLMEAHHALSAKIVEKAGFKGIWASGLSISAALGVRDSNEASWTQVLEVLEFMSDATSIPILLDGDTGYGNFNNARRLVKKLEQREVAGVCIEDKLFPKTNSFINGEAQPLADIDEFCFKIKAMKDTQKDDDFVVVSRVEAFIAGWGLREALRRAEAYRQAGTDAILIHSKISDVSEIEAFMKEWGNRLPVVIVPTKYYKVPTEQLRQMGISVAIWANHNLRASIQAMEATTKQIFFDESLINVEKKVAPLEKVFELQAQSELDLAEKKYLPNTQTRMDAIILATQPNCKELVSKQIDQLNSAGIKNVVVVGDSNHCDTASHHLTDGGEAFSIYQVKEKIKENTVISLGEMIYKQHVLDELLKDENDITIVVDADFAVESVNRAIIASSPYSRLLYSKTVNLVDLPIDAKNETIHGEFIGLWKVSKKGAVILQEVFNHLAQREDFKELRSVDLLQAILAKHPVAVQYIKGQWLDKKAFDDVQELGETK